MSILKIRDADGTVKEISVLKGDTPKKGVDYFTDDDKQEIVSEIANSITAEDVGARPDTWIPTAADVGAAPAGYGLGTNAVNPQTLDSIAANGYYEKAIDFGNGNGAQSCAIWHSQFGEGRHVDQFATVILGADQGSTFHRIKYEGVWHSWTKIMTSANFSYSNGTLEITTI